LQTQQRLNVQLPANNRRGVVARVPPKRPLTFYEPGRPIPFIE
jgi:hypothetical protein